MKIYKRTSLIFLVVLVNCLSIPNLIQQKKWNEIETALAEGKINESNINQQYGNGNTLIHMAVLLNNSKLLTALLNKSIALLYSPES